MLCDMGTRLPHGKEHSNPHFSIRVHCGQTAVWIKMPLGTAVGLRTADIVLDGDPASPRKGAQQPPTFAVYGRGKACVRINRGACLLWPNGRMDQDITWYGASPRPR